MPVYDDSITKVVKATSPTQTIVPKGTMPTTTLVPKPYPTEVLALLTEDGVEILIESGEVLTVQGAL